MPSAPLQFELHTGDGASIEERTSLSGTGVECGYYDTGQGESIVLLPGLLAGKDSFEQQICAFSILCRVLAVDLCFGIEPPNPVTLDDAATRLCDLLDERGVQRASLLGHSLGGSVALAFVRKYPERVIRLILSSPLTYITGATLMQRLRRKVDRTNIHLLRRADGETAAGLINRYCGRHGIARPEADDAPIRSYLLPRLQNGLGERLLNHSPRLRAFDLRAEVRQLGVPVLYMSGQHAPDVRSVRALASITARSLFHVIEGASQLSYLSHPAQFNAQVLSWLFKEVAAASRSLRPHQRRLAASSAASRDTHSPGYARCRA